MFVDQIDTRKGYFYGIAKSVEDFREELGQANHWRVQEQMIIRDKLHCTHDHLSNEQVQFVQQLVAALALPVEESRAHGIPYAEAHRSVGALQQDDLMVYVVGCLRN